VDFTSPAILSGSSSRFETTKESLWLEKNAHTFGFVLSYPKGKENITGYDYEPWHWRYIGIDNAKNMIKSGLCLEEFLKMVRIPGKTISEPLVSVIIPTHNRKELVLEAIDSVLKQDYKNVEVIVVDDGSTDGTFEYLKSLKLPIRIVRKKNGGSASARNAGLKLAKGEYVSFLDSDDIWLPGILACESQYLEHNPRAALVYSDYFIEVDGKRLDYTKFSMYVRTSFQMEHYTFPAFSSKQALIHISSTMIRKKILDEVGNFNEDLEVEEDSDLFNRISEKYRLHQINLPLAVYRLSKDKNHLTTLEKNNFYVKALRKYMKLYEARRKHKNLKKRDAAVIENSYRVIEQYESLEMLFRDKRISKNQFYLRRWSYYFLKQMTQNIFYFEVYGFIIKVVFGKTSDSRRESNLKILFLSSLGDFMIFKARKPDAILEIFDGDNKKLGKSNSKKIRVKKNTQVPYQLLNYDPMLLLENILTKLLISKKGFILKGIAIEKKGKAHILINDSIKQDSMPNPATDGFSLLSDKICVVRKIGDDFFYFQSSFFNRNCIISKTLGRYKIGKIILISPAHKELKKIKDKEEILSYLISRLLFPNRKFVRNMMLMISSFNSLYEVSIPDEMQDSLRYRASVL
jgi:glycosyltransferase involved in cell wall biosynthesis